MATSHDVLRSKTDAELRFFVDNPTFYQSELVTAARQELRRRYPTAALPTTAPPAPSPPDSAPVPLEGNYEDAPRRTSSWLLPASVAIVLLLAGAGFWGKTRQHQPASGSAARSPQTAAAPQPAAPRPLETAISAPPLPTYDAESYVAQALNRVPAAEKANEQHLSQYQAISRRFWAAQQPSAYLIEQVQAGKANPLFGAQVSIVLASWQEFDRTLIYSYDFGPVMGDHFRRMKTIASYQRQALTELSNTAAAHQPLHLVADQIIVAQQALPDLLTPLLAKPGTKAH